MKNFFQKHRRELLGFAALWALVLVQYCWFGFEYWLQLDDYIHYRELAAGTDPVQLCIDNGLFTSRPLAGLLDLVFWGRIPHFLGTVLLSAMYAGAAVLFSRLFRRIFGTGSVFAVVFTLLPLGFEGAYWHAAATRILPAMLFAAAAVSFLDAFVRSKQYWYLIPYLIFSLLSFCFYEQMLVLSLALSLMLICVYLLQKQCHSLWGLTIFAAVVIYAAVTGYFAGLADGQLAQRMKLVLPWDPQWLSVHIPRLMPQLRECFGSAGWEILTRGLVRGIRLIFSEGVFPAVLIPAVAVGLFLALRRQRAPEQTKLFHLTPLFALLAALAPVTPFLVIAEPWVCLRSVVPSFVGLALLADYLVRLVLRDRAALAVPLLAAVFLTCSVSELHDYRAVTLENQQVAQAILEADERYDLSGQVGILDLEQVYATEQNFLYHDHVMSAHASDWALTGLVRYHAGTPAISYTPTPLPLNDGSTQYAWTRVEGFAGGYPFVFLYDHDGSTLIRLQTVQTADDRWELYDDDGTLRAAIRREGGYGIIELICA